MDEHDPLPRFGTAYFGVRDPDHFRPDITAIADAGYRWILFPFTHDDAAWETSTFRAMVRTAEEHDLLTVISPWGGDEFGGEGVQTRLRTTEWLARARDTGARILHVDEPHPNSLTLSQILDAWTDDASVWLTIQPDRAWVLDRWTMRRVGLLGTDAYDGTLAERIETMRGFERQTDRLDLAWVRAFRIAEGDEAAVGETVEAMAGVAPYVGVWAWKGATGRGELRSARPAEVEREVSAAIERVTSTVRSMRHGSPVPAGVPAATTRKARATQAA